MQNWQKELDTILDCAGSGADAFNELMSDKAWTKIRVPHDENFPVRLSIRDAESLVNWIVSCSENLVDTAEENPSEYHAWMARFHDFNKEVGPKLMELQSYIKRQTRIQRRNAVQLAMSK